MLCMQHYVILDYTVRRFETKLRYLFPEWGCQRYHYIPAISPEASQIRLTSPCRACQDKRQTWGSFCVCAQPMRDGVVTPSLIGWTHAHNDPCRPQTNLNNHLSGHKSNIVKIHFVLILILIFFVDMACAKSQADQSSFYVRAAHVLYFVLINNFQMGSRFIIMHLNIQNELQYN